MASAARNQNTRQGLSVGNTYQDGLIYDSAGRGAAYTPGSASPLSPGSAITSNPTRGMIEDEGLQEKEVAGGRERRGMSKTWMLIALAAFIIVVAIVAGVVGAKIARSHDNSKSSKSNTQSTTSSSALAIPTPTTEEDNAPSSSTTTTAGSVAKTTKTTSTAATPTVNDVFAAVSLPTTGVLPNICMDSQVRSGNSTLVTTHSYPAQNNGYTSTFLVECNTDYLGNNIAVTTTYTFEQCLEACNSFNALNTLCKAVSWVANITTVINLQGGNCYLKNITDPASTFAIASFGGPQIGAFLQSDSSSS